MTEFQARLYDTDADDYKPVFIRVSDDKIHLNGGAAISFEDLDLDLAGHDEDRIKIRNRATGQVLICNDERLIDAMHRADTSGRLRARTESIKRKVGSLPFLKATYWLRVAAVVGAIIFGLYASIDKLVDAASEKIDPSLETQIGKLLVEKKDWDKKSEKYKRIEKIGKKLTSQLPKSPYKFDFSVDDDKEVNAFAYPGGFMVVNTGLIDSARSDDEIAGVMAHELGHVVHRDALKGVLHNAGVWVCVGIITGFGGDYSEQIAGALSLGRYLERQQFSRVAETNADMTGLLITCEAGYDPEGLIGFFERMENDPKHKDVKLLAFMSDHPLNSERIAAMRTELARLKRDHPGWFKMKAKTSTGRSDSLTRSSHAHKRSDARPRTSK